MRSKIEPALKDFGGATGDDVDDAALLVGAGDAVFVGRLGWRRRPCRESETAPMPGAAMPEPGNRAGRDVGVDEGHLGGMDRAGDRFLDKGVPARARRLDAGNQARHVLIGGDGRKADPDAEADDQRRQEGTLVSAGGGEPPRHKTSIHGKLSRTQQTHWRGD